MPRDHGNDVPVATYRDGLLPHRQSVAPVGIALATDTTLTPCAVDQRTLPVGQVLPDDVIDERGLRSHWPDLRDRNEPG